MRRAYRRRSAEQSSEALPAALSPHRRHDPDRMILDRVHEFIAQSIAQPGGSAEPSDDATFARLAREVFAHQYENVPLYRRLCELRGAGPRDVTHWWEIPAAPADLFKEESLSCGTDSPARTFLSSGTTQGPDRPSRHVLDASDLDLYRRCSLAHFA